MDWPQPLNGSLGCASIDAVCLSSVSLRPFGSGVVQVQFRQIGPGMVQQLQSTCSSCRGEGKVINERDKCKSCLGKKVGDPWTEFEFPRFIFSTSVCPKRNKTMHATRNDVSMKLRGDRNDIMHVSCTSPTAFRCVSCRWLKSAVLTGLCFEVVKISCENGVMEQDFNQSDGMGGGESRGGVPVEFLRPCCLAQTGPADDLIAGTLVDVSSFHVTNGEVALEVASV